MTSVTRTFRVDDASPLARAIRDSVRAYVWQKSVIGVAIDSLLRQYPDAVAPLVLAAVDGLARDGIIGLVPAICGVGIEWRGRAERAA